jgi:hypothetical protein
MHTDICAAPGPAGGGANTFRPRASPRPSWLRSAFDGWGSRGSDCAPAGFSWPSAGYSIFMRRSPVGDDAVDGVGPAGTDTDADRVERRAADLLPEERAAGSADPEAQAAAILEESDEREEHPGAAPSSFLERRSSEDTVTPPGETTR